MEVQDEPQNQEILDYFNAKQEPNNSFQVRISLRDLRTHPDLIERLDLIAEGTDGVKTRGYIGGCAVYVDARGIIFAFSSGMDFLALRLNRAEHQNYPTGSKVPRLSGWLRFDPWGHGNPSSPEFEAWVNEMRNYFYSALVYADEAN